MYKKTKFSIGVQSSYGTGVKFNRNKKVELSSRIAPLFCLY